MWIGYLSNSFPIPSYWCIIIYRSVFLYNIEIWMLNWLVKFLSVIPWMALVPRILGFTDFEDVITAGLACNFCSPAAKCEMTYRPIRCYFSGMDCTRGCVHIVSVPRSTNNNRNCFVSLYIQTSTNEWIGAIAFGRKRSEKRSNFYRVSFWSTCMAGIEGCLP